MSVFLRVRVRFPLMVAVLLVVGCRDRGHQPLGLPAERQATLPTVYVVNYPLQYFAQRIGGERVTVVFPAPADVDPAYWRPDEQTVQDYQNAGLILLNGAGYAAWIAHASLPSLRLVNTSRAFQDDYILLEDQVVHRHGPEGEHAHQGYASTTWLDPQLALRQAEAIQQAFLRRWPDPACAAKFRIGWEELQRDLEALDARLTEVNAAYGGQPLLSSHPVYQYLARRCGWNLTSVHWEPDEPVSQAQWQELEQLLQEHPVRWMIWESEPLGQTARRLRSLGIAWAVFQPCGNKPASGDYLQAMHANLERLRPMLAAAEAAAEPGL